MINSFLKKSSYFLVILPMSFLAFVLLTRGITYTYDSYNFLCGALSFKENSRILMCDHAYMTLSPPGFSIYLSCFLTNAKTISGIYKISSLLVYGLTLLCWIHIVKCELKDSKFLGFAFLSLLSALPLFYIHLFLWSEGIFLLLLSFGILSLIKFNKSQMIKWLLLASFSFCLLIIVRYAGLILYVLFLAGWVCWQGIRLRSEQIFILFLPLIMTASLMARNFYSDNVFFGERPFLNRIFFEILNACLKVICNWIVPVNEIPGCFYILILTLLLFLLTYCNKSIRLWLLPLVGYILFISYFAYRTDIEYDERLFVPVYPMFVLCIFKSLSQLPKIKFVNWVVLFFLISWILYSSVRLAKNIIMWLS